MAGSVQVSEVEAADGLEVSQGGAEVPDDTTEERRAGRRGEAGEGRGEKET